MSSDSAPWRRQSNEIQNNGASSNMTAGNGVPPPPPPPCAGNIPAVRIASEIGPRKEPPAAIQNAMMTKDKKPFTYTPGGLNLNEIRSPRMARRISKNAHIEDSCSQQPPPPATSPHSALPPAALAAMQPQIAIPVFPPGGPPPPPPLPNQGSPLQGVPAPPPPPPPPATPQAPPAPSSSAPAANPLPPQLQQDFHPPRPEFLADIASHPPLRPVGQPPRSSYDPSSQQPLQVQLKPVSPKPSPEPSAVPEFLSRPVPEQPAAPLPPLQVRAPPTPPTPPTPASVRSTPPTPPMVQQQRAPPTPPVHSSVRPPVSPPVQQQPQTPQPQGWGTPGSTPTPPLSKSPAPWMSSKPAQKEAPPPWAVRAPPAEPQPAPQANHQPVPQANHQPVPQANHQPVTRVIPIQIEGREPAVKTPPTTSYSQPSPPPQGPQYRYVQPPPNFPVYAPPTPPQYQQAVPPQYQQQQPQYHPVAPPMYQQPAEQGSRTRIIPIQIEGTNNPQPPPAYQTQNSYPGNGQQRSQNGDATDGRKFQTQTSYSGAPTQSRSFRVLQKITGSEDDTQSSEPVSSENNGWGTNTPPLYPNYPNYWYNPPQTPEEQQQFWEHYNAMCNYMAHMNATAMRYSPYPYPPYPSPYPYPPYPSDTEDYSNSSCDEMTYYGQMFKQHSEQKQQEKQEEQPVNENTQSSKETNSNENYEESEEDSDTEVDDVQANALKSIRSVPDIHVYADSDESTSEESESSDEDEPESDATSLPHQLSVIFEESELSSCEESKKTNEQIESASSSASTINENAVKVRLPLQLKFTRSENDEEVATLIVGNSEMESSKAAKEAEEKLIDDGSLIITDIVKEDSDPDVSATIILKKPKKESPIKSDESPVDFWKELTEDDKDESSRSASQELRNSEDDSHWEDDSSSTSVQTVKKGNSGSDTMSELEVATKVEKQVNSSPPTKAIQIEKEDEVSSESSSDDEEDEDENTGEKEIQLEAKLIEKIKEMQKEEEEDEENDEEDSSDSSESSDEESEHSNVFNENNSKTNQDEKDRKRILLSSKSFEESEEDDSGVTSDLSRHISETDTDPECGSELSKMSRCQRAATHSRLFKLLQEECEQEDEKEEQQESMSRRKERLTLPLTGFNTGEDSLSSSSGVNSPSSPVVNERLVKELVQSLLSKKKGRHFRKLPMEKLHAAAMRILQEDMDPYDTVSTSDESNAFLSPVANPIKRNITTTIDSSLNPEPYGINYYDYCNYYSTWGAVSNDVEPDYDIVPSKTFKILQGQADRFSPQTVRGVPVRCPRVPNSRTTRELLTTPVPSGSSPSPKDS